MTADDPTLAAPAPSATEAAGPGGAAGRPDARGGPPPRVEHVLLSDVHLIETVDRRPRGWWSYKDPDISQDADLVDFLRFLEASRPRAFDLTHVVFNGDTWDFDSVWSSPDGWRAGPEGVESTPAGSVYKLGRLLDDHPAFVAGLAAFLAAGNRATFVLGNHDRELAFPEVEELLRRRVAAAAPPGAARRVAEALVVEPWFVHVPGLFYAEHGQQYDATCSYRDVLWPFVPPDRRRDREIEASLGSVIGRVTLSRLGTFNPFDDASFLKSLAGYASHAWEYYWPRKPFFSVYLGSAFKVLRVARGLRRRALAAGEDTSPLHEAYAARKGVPAPFLAHLRRLSSPPVVDRLGTLMHELWLDRILIVGAAVLLVALGVSNARSWTQGLLMLTLLPGVALVLRALGRGSLALQERGRWGLVAEHVSNRLGVPIVAFGHSHRPERRPLRNGGRYYNLGTWAPVSDPVQEAAILRARRFLVIREDPAGRPHVAFQRWGEDGTSPF